LHKYEDEIIDDEENDGQITFLQCQEAALLCKTLQDFWKRYEDEFKRAEEMDWLKTICSHVDMEFELNWLPECSCPFEVECLVKGLAARFLLQTSSHNCLQCKAIFGSLCCGLGDQYGISPMSPMLCRSCDPDWAQKNIGKDHDAVVKKVPTIEDDLAPTQLDADLIKNYNSNDQEEDLEEEEEEEDSGEGNIL